MEDIRKLKLSFVKTIGWTQSILRTGLLSFWQWQDEENVFNQFEYSSGRI
ncbi:MAG: hypothetical protein ABS871_03670 [Methanobrevibacter sp.]